MKFVIEEELKYCLACEEEYMPEIQRCANCGRELLTGAQVLAGATRQKAAGDRDQGPIGEGEDVVPIHKGSVLDVQQAKRLLEREGIAALVTGATGQGGCGKGCCGSEVVLMVRRTAAEGAAAVLARHYVESTGLREMGGPGVEAVFDPRATHATCPACGCSFSTDLGSCPECGLCFL